MTMLASQITSLTVVYSIVYSGVNQRKHQSSASLAFVRAIHRGPVNFPHKWPVTRKMFPFDDVIMIAITTEHQWDLEVKKQHPISNPHGQAMRCPLWVFEENCSRYNGIPLHLPFSSEWLHWHWWPFYEQGLIVRGPDKPLVRPHNYT